MKATNRFGYMVFGGVIVVLALIVTSYGSRLSAQKDAFGEITCTGLTVLHPDGRLAVRLTADDLGGLIGVLGKDGVLASAMGSDRNGGRVEVFGKDEKSKASLVVDELGGMVAVVGNNENHSIGVYVAELGGVVEMNGEDKSMIALSFNEYGGHVGVIGHGGLIGILGKDMSPKAVIGAGDYGGRINVMGNKGFYPQAIVDVGDQTAQIKVLTQDGNTAAGMFARESESAVITRKDGVTTGYLGKQ